MMGLRGQSIAPVSLYGQKYSSVVGIGEIGSVVIQIFDCNDRTSVEREDAAQQITCFSAMTEDARLSVRAGAAALQDAGVGEAAARRYRLFCQEDHFPRVSVTSHAAEDMRTLRTPKPSPQHTAEHLT